MTCPGSTQAESQMQILGSQTPFQNPQGFDCFLSLKCCGLLLGEDESTHFLKSLVCLVFNGSSILPNNGNLLIIMSLLDILSISCDNTRHWKWYYGIFLLF